MKKIWKRLIGGAVLLIAFVFAVGVTVYRSPLWVADQQIRFRLWRAGVKSGYVLVDGERIHYFEARPTGGGEGVPLVLIHGLGDRGEAWAPMIPGLAAAGFHVFVPDLLGYGRSSRPDVSYAISMQGKLIADFMHAMHVERADVSGWSMGGWVAMKLALDHPSMVDRLILFDSAGIYFQDGANLDAVFDARDDAGVNRLFSMLTPHPRPIPHFVARDVVRRIQGNIWVVKRSMAAMTSGRDLMDFRLYALKQPTLIVWGKQDVLIPLATGESIHHGIPGSSMIVVDGCGHLTPSECSKVSLRETIGFLQSQPAMSGVERVVEGK